MKEKQTHSEQREHPWGWVITAAVFGCNALCVGYYRAFGVFFVDIIDTFQSSSSLTSLVMGVQSAVLSLSALVVHNVLLPVMGERRSALAGGFLMAGGMMLTTFATSISFLIFSLSVLVGLGNAMIYGPGLVLLGQYFERRRALAISVATTGASVGSMTLPLLATYLLQQYGLSGAWLLYGGVTLHVCVFAGLYRPQSAIPHGEDLGKGPEEDGESSTALLKDKGQDNQLESTKMDKQTEQNGHAVHVGSPQTDRISDDSENEVVKTKEFLKESTSIQEQNGQQLLAQRYLAYLGEESTAKAFCSADNVSSNNHSANGVLQDRRSSTVGDLRFRSSQHQSGDSVNLTAVLQRRVKDMAIHSSHPQLISMSPSIQTLSQELKADVFSTSEDPDESRQRCRGFWSKIACDGDLLRNPLFWMVLAYVCVGVVGSTGAGVYLPSLCQERGLDKEDTAVVLTTWGALNLVGRLLCGVLADRQWLKPAHISAISFLIIGILFQILSLLPSSLGSMVTLGAVYGMFEGAYFTMLPLIIIDFVSLKHFSVTFGFVQLSQGAFATIFYPLLGRLRDITGNYYATFHCLGACALTASLLLLLESGIRALKTKRSSEDLKSSPPL